MKILLVFTLYLISGLTVTYRQLSLQDAGSYQCGEAGVWNHTVNLIVNSDPCCLGPKTVSGYLGETVTISCSYPEEFKTNAKYFFKQNRQYFTEKIRNSKTQRSRFSISDDRISNILSVNISDVREDDGGVYYCAVGTGGVSVSYYSLYSEIQLQVTEKKTSSPPKQPPPASSSPKTTATYRTTSSTSEDHFSKSYRTTSTALPSITSEETNAAPGSSAIIIIIIVSVGVGLLLTGGSTLIFYKPRDKKRKEQTDYENDLPGNQISMSPIYQKQEPSNQSDSIYQSLDPNTIQSDSMRHCYTRSPSPPHCHSYHPQLSYSPDQLYAHVSEPHY
ncbi:hypothetical protein MHYP_G00104530 [Metynnis hypsauchen]